ncbi:MAG: efflux RND transporter periplasmic adaptor subunit [Spirochaetales bacterium]|nr:efflux RND transporter periplasmic adaptor subunit [Spirochaetales bacterium]
MNKKNNNETIIRHFTAVDIVTSCSILLFMLYSCSPPGHELRASGTIEATEIKVSAKANGEIMEMNVREGTHVKKGEVIGRIDSSMLDLKKKQAAAGVSLAEAQLTLLLKGAREEDIKQAEEQVIQARENYNQSKEDYERMENLHKTGSITAKQYDDAKTRMSVAQAQYNAARQGLAKLQNLARPEDIQMARARLQQAEVSLDLLEKQISDCTIVSPLDGSITHKLVEAGEFVVAGTPVVVVSDLTRMSVTIYIGEADLGRIRIGQEAYVMIDTHPEVRFSGTIAYISPEAEFTPKNIQTKEERIKQVFGVKIELPNPQGTLKAGIPADAVVPVDPGDE